MARILYQTIHTCEQCPYFSATSYVCKKTMSKKVFKGGVMPNCPLPEAKK